MASFRSLVFIWLAAVLSALSSNPARAEESKKIRLGHFPNITHAQAIYGLVTGDFELIVGSPVEWSQFNAGPSAIEALFTAAIDAAYIGPNPTINGYVKSRGGSFVVLAGAASGGAALVVRDDAGIASESDFADKIVATPQLGNTQDVAARIWFRNHGYETREKGGNLTILPLANPDQLLMFQRKEIHAAWTIEPWVTRLVAEAGGRVFLDEASLWPEGRYVTTHLIVRRKFLAENPGLVRNLLRAHVEITRRINADKPAAVKILANGLKQLTGKALPEPVIQSALERVELTWDPIAASLHDSAQAAHEIGFLKQAPNLEGLYDLVPLNETLASLALSPLAEPSDGKGKN